MDISRVKLLGNTYKAKKEWLLIYDYVSGLLEPREATLNIRSLIITYEN